MNDFMKTYLGHVKTKKLHYLTDIFYTYKTLKTLKAFSVLMRDTDTKVKDFEIISDDDFRLVLHNKIEFEKLNFKLMEFNLNAMIIDCHQIDFKTFVLRLNRSKTNEYNRLPKRSIDRLEAVLRYLKIKFEYVQSIENEFELEYTYWVNLDIKKIMRMSDSIAHKVGWKKELFEIRAEEGNIVFKIKKDNKQIFYLSDVLLNTKRPNNMTLPFVLGVDKSGKVIFADLKDVIHSLLGGTPGSGKSESLKQWIDSLLYYNDNVFLYCIDFKESALRRYKRFTSRCKYVDPEYNAIISLLQELIDIYKERKNLFAVYEDETGLNCPDIHEWNKLHPDSQLPYILLAVDEATSFKDELSKKEMEGCEATIDKNGEITKDAIIGVSPLIMTLLSKGRSLGIHVVFAVQKSTEQCFSVKWRSLCFTRMCHKMRESRQVQYTLECTVDDAKKVMNHDVGWFTIDQHGEYKEIKATLTSQELLNNIIKYYDEMEGEMENENTVVEQKEAGK